MSTRKRWNEVGKLIGAAVATSVGDVMKTLLHAIAEDVDDRQLSVAPVAANM